MISTLATLHVPQPAHGGIFAYGQPCIIVMHSIECPIERGVALNVAQGMAHDAQVSVHYLVDPGAIVAALDESFIGWGAGTVNSAAIHIEQAGYAAYSRAQWTTAEGLAMLKLAGGLVADIAVRHGIPRRWLTDSELDAAWKGEGPGGLTTHAQCSRVIGGTTHTDPGPNYPTDLLLEYAASKATQTPAQSQEDDMPLSDADAEKVADKVIAKLRVMPLTVRNYATPPAGQDYELREDRPFAVVIQDISAYASQASRRGK